MKLATNEQSDVYLAEGADFIDNTEAPFGDVKRIAKLAIAEYLANKDGLTIYESVSEK